MTVSTLRCYRCQSEYGYVGSAPHPGRCPECNSACVPPAGRLSVVDRSYWESAIGLSKAWVRAVDERDRPFEFEIAAKGSEGRPTALTVDGTRIDPRLDERLGRLPDAVVASLAELGIGELEPTRTVRTEL